jgi:hypothetical protein
MSACQCGDPFSDHYHWPGEPQGTPSIMDPYACGCGCPDFRAAANGANDADRCPALRDQMAEAEPCEVCAAYADALVKAEMDGRNDPVLNRLGLPYPQDRS